MLGKALQLAAAGNSAEEGVLFKDISDYSHVRFNTMSSTSGFNCHCPFVSSNGTKFYTLDGAKALKEYSLSTAYDISTSTVTHTITNVGASNGNDSPTAFYIKPDGTRLWIGDNDDFLYVWDLSTAWTLSTASYIGRDDMRAPFNNLWQPFFKPDGTLFMAIDPGLDRVKGISVPTAWNIFSSNPNSASTSALFDISPINETVPVGLFWSNDGTKVYITGDLRNEIMMWNTDPWDVADITGSPDDTLDISSIEGAVRGICFSADGKHMYIAGAAGQGVDQFVRN